MTLKPINDVDDVYEYLYAALQLEHATIPPYLTALYSIHPGTNSDAFHVIRVVVIEEMLHLTLAANILNAIGGTPDLLRADFVPSYPTYLPDGEEDFQVGLQRFSKEAIDTFLKIERPAEPMRRGHTLVEYRHAHRGLLPAFKADEDTPLRFYSIGEFYQAISQGLEKLCNEQGEANIFRGDRSRQVTREYYYSGGGDIVPVYDLASAQLAIRLISEQGEGYDGGIFDNEGELSHFYRFQQLMLERYYLIGDTAGNPTGGPVNIDWNAVYPIQTNAKLADYPSGTPVHTAAVAFNTFYGDFLRRVNHALNGEPQELLDAVGGMFQIRDRFYQLIRNPIPGQPGVNAAPTFEMQ